MRRSRGFTLVELLVAVSLVGLLAVTVMGAFTVGHRSVKGMAEGLDANQQLRAAVKMMTDDLSFANWIAGPSPNYCYVPNGDYILTYGCVLEVLAYQPTANRSGGYWNSFPDWPGDLSSTSRVLIRYRLDQGDLIREVSDFASSGRVYSSRVLLSGLLPYDGDGSDCGSQSTLCPVPGRPKLVQLVLRMPVTAGGSTNVAQISSVFYMR
jgi:prepilin-type N-terminal cleavage/methylation domain-containing protein